MKALQHGVITKLFQGKSNSNTNTLLSINFFILFIPFLLYLLSFVSDTWRCALGVYIFTLLFSKKEFIVFYLFFFSFFNIMSLSDAPFWLSLCTTFGGLGILFVRLNAYMELYKNRKSFIFLSVLLLWIWSSFYFYSVNSIFEKTGLKSAIQLSFLISFTCIIQSLNKKNLNNFFFSIKYAGPACILIYAVFAIFTFDADYRMQAFCGAQIFGLILVIVLIFFKDNPVIVLILTSLIILSGSRTYLALFILCYLLYIFKKYYVTKHKYKLVVISVFLLPFFYYSVNVFGNISGRFSTQDEEKLTGSFFGRFSNYIEGIDMIYSKPILGNGMGSMLLALDTPIYNELKIFQTYQEKGDTTIMHNEYIRIAVELGLIGLCIMSLIIFTALRYGNFNTRSIIFTLCIGSLLENTLAGYSTGMITCIIGYIVLKN